MPRTSALLFAFCSPTLARMSPHCARAGGHRTWPRTWCCASGGPLAGYTRHVQDRLKKRTPYPELIQIIRTGPPKLSLFGWPGADEKLNLVEYFVHHEDARRAQQDWKPRELSPDLADVLWARLGMARLMMRK